MSLYKDNQQFNTIFGTIAIKGNDGLGEGQIAKTTASGFGIRETGIALDIKDLDDRYLALKDPDTFIKEKRNDILSWGDKLGFEYRRAYTIAFNRYLPEKECEKYANEAMLAKKKELKDENEYKWPSKLLDASWKKISKF